MARKPNIKWGESDAEKLDRVVKSFNKKIYNTRNRHPELKDIQPDTITNKDKLRMIEEFKNMPRSEFNKTLNSLERYSKPGAEKAVKSLTGNKVTKWEKKEVGLKVGQINRQRTVERKAFKADEPGQFTRKMGEFKQNELKPKPFNFDKIKGGKEWELFKKSVNKQAKANYSQLKMDIYKKNYLQAIEMNLGSYGKELYDLINQIPAETLYKYYWEEDAVLRIQFSSEPLPAKMINEESMNHWKAALGEDYIQGLQQSNSNEVNS